MMKMWVAIGSLAIIFEILALGGLRAEVAAQMAATGLLYFAMAVGCRRLVGVSLHAAMRNFWRAAAIGSFVRAAADLGQAATTIAGTHVAHLELQTPASKAMYAVGLVVIGAAFVSYPLEAGSPRERTRLFLDLCTIMIVVAAVGWYTILAPSLGGSATAGEVVTASVQFGFVLVYANFFRLVLSNINLLTRRTTAIALASIALLAGAEALMPEVAGTGSSHWVLAVRVLAVLLQVVTIRNQVCELTNDPDAQRPRRSKPFNVSPYLAVSALYALLIVSLARDAALSLRIWGLLVAAVLTLALVVIRQLTAFVDNARLVQRLDENLQQLQQSYDREQRSNKARAELEIKLRHAQKLEALGRMAGGLAHEINTPIQYVTDNMTFLRDSFARLSAVVDDCIDGKVVENPDEVSFLKAEVPASIDEATGGLRQISTIVQSLQSFGGDETDKGIGMCDVASSIADTLVVLRHDLDRVPEVALDRGTGNAFVHGNARDLAQVWFALISNAIQAIDESGVVRGRLSIRVSSAEGRVVVEVADNGVGIAPDVADRVFDPFFTTRDVGLGKGQGLAIARTIVVDGHDGALTFTSEAGGGTVFRVELPTADAAPAPVASPHGMPTAAR